MEKDTLQKLRAVQAKLKAPKGQFNKFGGYKYRNCEDILEATKPLLDEHELTITISDSIELVGERYYVKATVFVNGEEAGSAFAREDESKKGMDLSQLTGSCSSYARKYALNGVLLIDDTKDADSADNTQQAAPKTAATPPAKPATTASKKKAPPAYDETINEGCKKWEDWKTQKGTTLAEIKASDKMDNEGKVNLLKKMKAHVQGLAESADNEVKAKLLFADVAFIDKGIEEIGNEPF